MPVFFLFFFYMVIFSFDEVSVGLASMTYIYSVQLYTYQMVISRRVGVTLHVGPLHLIQASVSVSNYFVQSHCVLITMPCHKYIIMLTAGEILDLSFSHYCNPTKGQRVRMLLLCFRGCLAGKNPLWNEGSNILFIMKYTHTV